jgi:hypothetical protein
MTRRWKAGDAARVVDLSGLRLPGKGRAPWTEGAITRVLKVSDDGSLLHFPEHSGWFRASRFDHV